MNSQAIDVKITIYEKKVPGSRKLGYQAKIKANVLEETIITNVYTSAIALFYKGIDPIIRALHMKAFQNRRGFSATYKNSVEDREQMVSGIEVKKC